MNWLRMSSHPGSQPRPRCKILMYQRCACCSGHADALLTPFCRLLSWCRDLQERYGEAMLANAVRRDLDRTHACTGREMLFKHGGMGQPPVSCYLSLKTLTDGELQRSTAMSKEPAAIETSHLPTCLSSCSPSPASEAPKGGAILVDWAQKERQEGARVQCSAADCFGSQGAAVGG